MELGGGSGSGDGESAAKRARPSSDDDAAAGEDRISALPNEVLVLILLKLSTRAAAQTRVLSRSWRRIWALLPTLHFDEGAEPERLRDALDAHEVPLRSLHVGADGATAQSLGVWLPAAARRVSGDLSIFSFSYAPVKDEDIEEEEDDDDDDEEEEEEEAPRTQRGAFELPCFEKATFISLVLGFQGLAVPPTGVFARLTDLHLHRVWFHGPGELGHAVSSPRCPCLQRLSLRDARGLGDLAIHSESLLELELRDLRTLSQLTVVAPALKQLAVDLCFVKNRPVSHISAPQLMNLNWSDEYDPSSVHLGKMPHLRWLSTDFYLVYGYGNHVLLHNQFCLALLHRFEGIEALSLSLMYPRDIENYEYMMEDMTMLPDITSLRLMVVANGHAFQPSAFHVLRLCTGVIKLMLQFGLEVSAACSSDCICDEPADWETEELLLNHLEQVEIIGWRGSEHEVAFVKQLFNWGTKLKEMTVNFKPLTSEIKAKELYQIFQSFSRPGVCMKFYLYQKHRKVLYAPED